MTSTVTDEFGPVLERISGADLYRNNAFRVTGLPPDATPAQIRRAREEAVLLSKVGAPPGQDADTETIRAAFETLRDPVARLTHELLWPGDSLGGSLAARHEAAVRTHREAVEAEATGPYEPGSDEAHAQDPLWEHSLAAWASVLAAREFWDHARRRVAEIGDPRLTTGTVRRLRERLPRHLLSVTVGMAARAVRGGPTGPAPRAADRLVGLLRCSPFDEEAVNDALREAARPAERTIRAACETATRTAEADEDAAAAAGRELRQRIEEPLRVVQALLGPDAPLTAALSEEAAVALNVCQVIHFNAEGDPQEALPLVVRAGELARDPRTREVIARNRSAVEDALAIPSGPDSCLPAYLREMCKQGNVDRAAAHLRAIAREVRSTNPELARDLRTWAADRRTLAGPFDGELTNESCWGIGVHLLPLGTPADPRLVQRGVRVATHAWTVLFIPLFPMAAYLVEGRRVHVRVPMGGFARAWRRLLLTAVPAWAALLLSGASAALGMATAMVLAQLLAAMYLQRRRVRAWLREEDTP